MYARSALCSLALIALLSVPHAAFAQSTDGLLDFLLGTDTPSAETPAESMPARTVGLLWESDTYTPNGYRGKNLPSAGSKIRLWAVPDKSFPAASTITYTWYLDGAALSGQSGVGKNTIVINAPTLFSSYVVSVEAKDAGGNYAVSETRISSVEPVLRLYADHPLFGVERWKAVGANDFREEREMTFVAIPYFAAAKDPHDPLLQYAWRVDRKNIAADPERPNAITVRAESDGTRATFDLVISHAVNFLVESRGTWQITLGVGAGANIFDPFGTI